MCVLRRNFFAGDAGSLITAFRCLFVAVLSISFVSCTYAGVTDKVNFRRPVLVPEPVELNFKSDVAVRLDKGVKFTIICPDKSAVGWMRKHIAKWFGFTPMVSASLDNPISVTNTEGYVLSAVPENITVEASTLQGVRYALYTLRQIAEPISVGRVLQGWRMPQLKIKDEPAMKFRGVHFCCFPETTAAFLERQIRVAAYYKFNYAVIESWGMFRSARYPFLSLKQSWMTPEETKRLAILGKELGIMLIPQFNVFGHATGATFSSGKHITMDYYPEYAPLFEPRGGWNWCLSNPETLKVQTEYLAEMHEAFGNPPFVHIGCDEANPPSCASCRSADSYGRMFVNHVISIASAMRSRGARIMMWHDMLLDENDDRWNGFYANGTKEIADMMQSSFPKDAVVCDWYYGQVPESKDYPTLRHFKNLGFDVLTCPWKVENVKGSIASQGRFVRDNGMFGMLQTIWNQFKAVWFGVIMEEASCAAWGTKFSTPYTSVKPGKPLEPRPFADHWRQCGWDMGTPEYSETGYFERQMTR